MDSAHQGRGPPVDIALDSERSQPGEVSYYSIGDKDDLNSPQEWLFILEQIKTKASLRRPI